MSFVEVFKLWHWFT